MGIRKLNKFLREKCKDAIIKRYMEELDNKTIVIDISIYMYKYKALNKLMEKMYDMCSLFYKHNINAIFVFDGKSSYLKKVELEKRKDKKDKAREKYNNILDELEHEKDDDKIEELENTLTTLKKQFIYITREDKKNVKQMIRNFGLSYIQSQSEADELCAYLCNKEDVYACMSDDMDMFAYGCKRVLRYFNLSQATCIEYDFNTILESLQIDITLFRQLCVLSGTDYNETYKLKLFPFYKTYKELFMYTKSQSSSIYEYYYSTDEMIQHANIIEKEFDISNYNIEYTINKKPMDIKGIQEQMTSNNFYFV